MSSFWNKEIFNLRPSQEILDLQQKYVDNLKPKKIEKVKELRNRVSHLLKPTHNDFYLLKWLRARKFDVSAAENMLKANLKWRKEWRVDYIHEFEPPEVIVKYMPLGLVGEDKDGCPVWILPSGNLDVQGGASSIQKSDFLKYYIYFLEYMEKATIQQSEKHKKLITTHTLIFDLENFKMQDFIWKPVFDLFAFQLKLYEAYYPEFLKTAIIVNSPKVIHVLFGMVKPFLSEDTRKKIDFFQKDGWKEALLEKIDADQLPKHWGGTMLDEVDGNPYCSSKVVMGGTIPKSYYKTLKMDPDKMNCATVPSKGVLKADIQITEPGCVISWTFQTEDHDIGFGLSMTPHDNEQRNGIDNNHREKVVIPLDRANSYLVPEDGKFKCQETGTYTFTFDNSYSWTRNKKVLYVIQVTRPDSSITDILLNIPE